MQTLVDDPEEFVSTNARLARFASLTAAIGVAAAAGVFAAAGAEWSLRAAAVLFAFAGLAVLRARPRASAAVIPDDVEYAETHLPTVVVSSIGLLAIRAAVGFFIFTLAFTLRRSSEPALVYGLAAAAYGAGAFLGHTAATVLRRWFSEEQLIGMSLAPPASLHRRRDARRVGSTVDRHLGAGRAVDHARTQCVRRAAPAPSSRSVARSGRRPIRDPVPARRGCSAECSQPRSRCRSR